MSGCDVARPRARFGQLAHDAQLVLHAPPAPPLPPGDDLHHAVHRHTSSTNLRRTLRCRAGHTQAAHTGRLHKECNLIERFFNKLKQFRRVATRYDKLLANYEGFVQLAAIAILLR